MKEIGKDRLEQSLGSLIEWIERTGNSITEQAPVVAREIVAYELSSSLLVICNWLVFLISLGGISVWMGKSLGKTNGFMEDAETVTGWRLAFTVISILVLIFPIATQISCIIKTQVAPSVIVVETVSKML